jgi:hypothetical protein
MRDRGTYSELRFGIKDAFAVVGLMLVVVGLIELLFECLAWRQSGVWAPLSMGAVADYFGVPSILATHSADALQKAVSSALQVALKFPFSITIILIGGAIAAVADHLIFVGHVYRW